MEKHFSRKQDYLKEVPSAEFFEPTENPPEDSREALIDEMNELFAEEQRLLRILSSNNTQEVISILKETKEKEQVYLVMKKILERGRKETHFFDGLIEMDVYQTIIDGDMESPKIDGKKVGWRKKIKDFDGIYDVHKGVEIVSGPPRWEDLVTTLAIVGELPQTIKILLHELIHSTQFSAAERWKTISKDALFNPKKNYDSIPVELREAQAYRTADFPSRSSNSQDIINTMEGSYTTDPEKLEYAIEAIDRLQAAGFTIAEIGKLIILPEKWDDQKKMYPEIEAALSKKLKEQGKTDSNIHHLKQIYRLKQSIDSIKVTLIAREELRTWKAEKDAKALADAA